MIGTFGIKEAAAAEAAEEGEAGFQLLVVNFAGTTVTLDGCLVSDTIDAVAGAFATKLDLPKPIVRLMLEGTQLDAEYTLAHYQIAAGCQLHALPRLRGGGGPSRKRARRGQAPGGRGGGGTSSADGGESSTDEDERIRRCQREARAQQSSAAAGSSAAPVGSEGGGGGGGLGAGADGATRQPAQGAQVAHDHRTDVPHWPLL